MSRLQRAVAAHPRHALCAAACLGIALAPAPAIVPIVCALLAVLVLLACGALSAVAVAACALAVAGSALGTARLGAIDADPLAEASGMVAGRAYLVQPPRPGPTGATYRARLTLAGGENQLVEIRTRSPVIHGAWVGSEVFVRGPVVPVSAAAARTPAGAAYARYLLRNGVRRRIQARELALTGRARGGAIGFVDTIRIRSERALAFGLAPEPAALLRGMVLGGDGEIPESTVADFRVAGLAHILAVSGQNVLLIVILVQAILVGLGAGRRSRLAVSAAVIAVYVLLCGAQASVLRAGVMGLAGLAAIAASRPTSRAYALLLAALVTLVWNPRATADAGAQLSFAAVLGMMAFTGPLGDQIRRRWPAVPRWACDALAATLGATAATAPLMAVHFGTFSLVSPLANLLGEPLIGPIVWLGSLTAALAQISPAVAALFNAPNGFLLGALIELAHLAASVPAAQVELPGFATPGVIAAFVLLGYAAAALHRWVPAPPMPRGGRVGCYAAAVALAAICLVFRIPATSREVRPPAIVMLDVGQGDATLLRGSAGCDALIDGGPPGSGLAHKLRGLGVRQLDAVLVTHPQNDHHGGIAEIAESGSPPVAAWIDGGGNTADPSYARLRRDFAAHDVPSEPAVAGTEWSCGDLKISVIGPAAAAPDAPPPADPNTRAAVTLVEAGPLTMLASGDAESPQLAALALPHAEILKVPHHGSADPGIGEVLARVRPRVALIGVGADNRFGHPVPATLAALSAAGAAVYRTDRDGTIVVGLAAGGQPAVSTVGGAR